MNSSCSLTRHFLPCDIGRPTQNFGNVRLRNQTSIDAVKSKRDKLVEGCLNWDSDVFIIGARVEEDLDRAKEVQRSFSVLCVGIGVNRIPLGSWKVPMYRRAHSIWALRGRQVQRHPKASEESDLQIKIKQINKSKKENNRKMTSSPSSESPYKKR